ncbi:MAG: ABC transporter ATP-binding protein [Gemmatimonadota bacterium]|nr:ABC transporter ATP-binding protein [Gemmatimonadota bacterium]
MIRARGLAKQYGGVAVLRGLDLNVRAGERVAVLGLNGAGKTTLIRCLLGLTEFAGELDVAGHDVRTSGLAARRAIGYVPQRPPHFDGTLRDIVAFFCRLRGLDAAAVHAQLEELGLAVTEHGDKHVRTLSGGMLQKTLLGLALGAQVDVLLLDEPTANLDAPARREFLRALRSTAADRTVLLATHRLADVEAVADRLLVLHEGRIAFAGRMRELWDAVGADVTLWIQVPPDRRGDVERHVAAQYATTTVLRNGSAFGVKIERTRRVDLLGELRTSGVTVEDFWTEAPSLHDLMDQLLATRPAGPEDRAE